MNDSTKSISITSFPTTLIACCQRVVSALVLGGLAMALLVGCKSDPYEVKKRKPKPYRDPVEQRVFYDGWWPK